MNYYQCNKVMSTRKSNTRLKRMSPLTLCMLNKYLVVFLFVLMLYVPVNNFSVMLGKFPVDDKVSYLSTNESRTSDKLYHV